MLFLDQRKRKNGRRNIFMTKSSQKDVPDARIDRGASCFPNDIATDRAIAPSFCASNCSPFALSSGPQIFVARLSSCENCLLMTSPFPLRQLVKVMHNVLSQIS